MSSHGQENDCSVCFSCFSGKQLIHVGRIRLCLLFQGCSLRLPLFTQSHLEIVLKTREEIVSCSQTICKWFFPKNPPEGFQKLSREKMLMSPHLSQTQLSPALSRGLARDVFGSSLKLRGFRKCTVGRRRLHAACPVFDFPVRGSDLPRIRLTWHFLTFGFGPKRCLNKGREGPVGVGTGHCWNITRDKKLDVPVKLSLGL